MDLIRYKIIVTLNEEMLGTSPSSPDVYREFIASQAPDAAAVEDEVAALGVDEVDRKGTTVFPRHNGQPDGIPVCWDYQIKGFCKDACSMLSRVKGSESSKVKAFRKLIDGVLFVYPRQIQIVLPVGCKMGICSRPLRASTPQGDRVALSKSETVPAGSTIAFEVKLMGTSLEKALPEWLDYGTDRGLGQWRNSGKGRFCYRMEQIQ